MKSQTTYSATKRELLAVVNFTRHFRHCLLGRQLKILTHHSALPWLHNFKSSYALTARWLEKLAAFNYEVVHRPGESIGHGDSFYRTQPRALNMVSTQLRAANQPKPSDKDETETERPNRSSETDFLEKEGNLLDSDESSAHYVSADFKITAGVDLKIKQKFRMSKPNSNSVRKEVLWPQIIEITHQLSTI